MIKFAWNGIEWSVADFGGGVLTEDIAPHSHSKNGYELHFITGGSGILIANQKEYKLKKGDFFVTGPDIRHAQYSSENAPLTDVFIYLQKIKNKNVNIAGNTFLNKKFAFYENFDLTVPLMIFNERNNEKFGCETAVQGLMIYLLTEIARIYIPNYDFCKVKKDNLNVKRFVIIENEFLYNNQVTLHSLSEKIGVCERQTQRLLLKYYGMTFREKKMQAKIQKPQS